MDLHLALTDAPGRSLRERAEHALRGAVRALPPGERLPPTRALATELGVSRGVVVEAYAQLAAEGYLLTRRGGGTFVAHTTPTPAAPAAAKTRDLRAPRYDLRPTLPALDGAFRPAWGRALNRALRTTPDARLGYPDPQGEPELRAVLASSLARRRGVHATPDDVRVTAGLGPSLPFVWRLLRERGVRRVAIEDPCWPRLPASLEQAGLEPVPLDVDEHGMCVDGLERVDAAFVTPAHQFPTGTVLSPERRAALIAWARSTGALVLEDDYDAEYRYDRQPVGSLQGLAPDVVIYGGSTSKTLASWLAARVARAPVAPAGRAARHARGARPAGARGPARARRLRPPPAPPSPPLPAAQGGAAGRDRRADAGRHGLRRRRGAPRRPAPGRTRTPWPRPPASTASRSRRSVET